jgi:hypothetical protein
MGRDRVGQLLRQGCGAARAGPCAGMAGDSAGTCLTAKGSRNVAGSSGSCHVEGDSGIVVAVVCGLAWC